MVSINHADSVDMYIPYQTNLLRDRKETNTFHCRQWGMYKKRKKKEKEFESNMGITKMTVLLSSSLIFHAYCLGKTSNSPIFCFTDWQEFFSSSFLREKLTATKWCLSWPWTNLYVNNYFQNFSFCLKFCSSFGVKFFLAVNLVSRDKAHLGTNIKLYWKCLFMIFI